MKKYFLQGCALMVLLVLAGCTTPIGADKVASRQAYLNLNRNALNSSDCSADTLRVLHRYDLENSFAKNPDVKVGDLMAAAVATMGENVVVKRFARFVLGN